MMLQIPILFLVFNREETTMRVLDQIRKARPSRLYVAADGPRIGNFKDISSCKRTRELVLEGVDWPCEVKTMFRDTNLGCGMAVSQSVNWFFQQEEKGIILEDDCLPDNSFFPYCEELLNRYEDDPKVMSIGGCNFQKGKIRGNGSYYFSKYAHMWGWATWRRAWEHYSFDLKEWESKEILTKIEKESNSKGERTYWHRIYWEVLGGKQDIWDYQWILSIWRQEGMAISPNQNLVENIGFGEGATHTSSNHAHLKSDIGRDIGIITHPTHVKVDREADEYTFRNHFAIPMSFSNRLRNISYRLLPSFLFEKWRSLKNKMAKQS